MARQRTRRYVALAVALVLGTLLFPAAPATATHGPACLDLTPESDSNYTGIEPHTITATLRNPGSPNLLACTGSEVTRGDPVFIDFEVTGPSDPEATDTAPNGVDSRNTPDFTCTIPADESSCSMTYTGPNVGTDTIRGWVDEDGADTDGDGEHETTDGHGGDDSDSTEGTNETTAPGEELEPDATDVVAKTWRANQLDCVHVGDDTPTDDEDENEAGQDHFIECTARDADGDPASAQPLDLEEVGANDEDDGDSKTSPDHSGTTDANGEFTFEVTNEAEEGITTFWGWVDRDNANGTVEADSEEGVDEVAQPGDGCDNPDTPSVEPDCTDVLEKEWTPETGTQLDCDDQSGDDQETNPQGESENYTCTVRDAEDNPQPDNDVHGENLSTVNDPDPTPEGGMDPADYSCEELTGANGRCIVNVPGSDDDTGEEETGPADICFWIDDGDDGDTDDFDIDGDPGDGGNCDTEPAPPQDNTEEQGVMQDETDSVQKTWARGGVSEIAGGLDVVPESGVNIVHTNHRITARVFDSFGQPVPDETNIVVKFEYFMGSPSDEDGNTPGAQGRLSDESCTTTRGDDDDPSTCSINPRGPRTRAGRDLICVWIGERPPAMAGDNTNGVCDGEGRSDATGDQTDTSSRTHVTPSPSNDRIDVIEKFWAASAIDCTPEEDRNRAGQSHTVTCKATASDRFGETVNVSGQQIDAEASGAGDGDGDSKNTPDFTCTTGSDGTCSFSHTSTAAGQTTYTAWLDENQTNDTDFEPSDTVTKTWGASRVDCSPETDSNPRGTSHTVTCTARDSQGNPGQPVAGEEIDWELSGSNDPDESNSPGSPDHTCTTGSDGSCAFTHTGNETGTTTYRAWLDDDGDNDPADADRTETRDEGNPAGAGSTPEPDSTDVVEKNWVGPGLDCTPETDTNNTGETHTITCTYRDSSAEGISDATINVEATGANDPDGGNSPDSPDFECTTGDDGSCTIQHTGTARGTTTYRAWVEGSTRDDSEAQNEGAPNSAGSQSEPDETDVVTKTWVTQVLDCSPETDRNPAGSSHTVSCEAETSDGIPQGSALIDVEATGANDPDDSDSPETPDFTCTTDRTGVCTFTHSSTSPGGTSEPGTTLYRAWVDRDGNHSASPPTHGTVEADRTEGRNEAQEPGSLSEPDATDVVEKIWDAPRLDCNPETDSNPSGSAHVMTCRATASDGSNMSNANVDVEATGANDPDGGDSKTSPDFTCTTTNQGTCSFTHGPGGTGRTDSEGTTLYRAWIDLDKNNSTEEADDTEGRDEASQAGQTAEPDSTDVIEKTWTAPPIDCEPEQDGNPAGSSHEITCETADANKDIDVEATGANDPDGSDSPNTPDFSCRTTGQRECSFTHGPGGTGTTNDTGRTTYRAWIDEDGSNGSTEADQGEARNEESTPGEAEPDDTDVVEKNWTETPQTLTLSPENDGASVGRCNAFTITIVDASNAPVEGLFPDVEQRHEDPDGPTVSFCTPTESDGPNPSGVDQTEGDLSAPDENPDDPGTLGGETQEATDENGHVTIGISVEAGNDSDGTGEVSVDAFFDESDDDDPNGNDPRDESTKTWVAPSGRSIDCQPDSANTAPGSTHTVTCTVRDQFGEPIAGEDVTFTEDGPGDFSSSPGQTTDSDGEAEVTLTSEEKGSQSITGTISDDLEGGEPDEVDECDRPGGDPSGSISGQCSDTVTNEWGGQDRKRVRTTISIRRAGNKFTGRVVARAMKCRQGRTVKLIRQRGGADTVLGTTRSSRGGKWRMRSRARRGRVYAVAKKKVFTNGKGVEVTCLRAKSRTIRG